MLVKKKYFKNFISEELHACKPAVPAIQGADARGSLESRIEGQVANMARPSLLKKKKKKKSVKIPNHRGQK
jgi:hypothetical protein